LDHVICHLQKAKEPIVKKIKRQQTKTQNQYEIETFFD
jgi:hypothetical protein